MTLTPLVVTADDYGLTDATSRAIVEAHRRGIVTATSVLAVAPGVGRRLALLDDAPELSVGVHLALVGEDPPVLAAHEVPTLVDRRGRLASSWRVLLPRLLARRIDPDDVRRELDAQIELVAADRAVTHLDAHQHVHLWPAIGAVVVALAQQRGIGAVRVPRPTSTGSAKGRALARLADGLDGRLEAAGLDRTARFRGLDEAGRWDRGTLEAALADLGRDRDGGPVEINVHPGAVHDPDRARFRWGYSWGQELEAVTDARVRVAVERHGFELVGR